MSDEVEPSSSLAWNRRTISRRVPHDGSAWLSRSLSIRLPGLCPREGAPPSLHLDSCIAFSDTMIFPSRGPSKGRGQGRHHHDRDLSIDMYTT